MKKSLICLVLLANSAIASEFLTVNGVWHENLTQVQEACKDETAKSCSSLVGKSCTIHSSNPKISTIIKTCFTSVKHMPTASTPMKAITNKSETIYLPFSLELYDWLVKTYPYSKYKVIEIE